MTSRVAAGSAPCAAVQVSRRSRVCDLAAPDESNRRDIRKRIGHAVYNQARRRNENSGVSIESLFRAGRSASLRTKSKKRPSATVDALQFGHVIIPHPKYSQYVEPCRFELLG